MSDWPHDRIYTAAIRSIRAHVKSDADWRFTHIDALPERLARIAPLNPDERSLVSCFIDAQRWYVMTTSRIFGIARGARFECSPLEITHWKWGDSNESGRPEVGIATLSLKSGTHLRIAYERGAASAAPASYEQFWTNQYPTLGKSE